MARSRKKKRSGIQEIVSGKKYFVRPYFGKDPVTGKSLRGKQVTIHGTYKDAEKAYDDMVAAHKGGLRLDADKMTFGALANDWLAARELEGSLSPSTITHNKTMLRRILPTLGNAKVVDIRPEHCELVLRIAKADGMSNTTLHQIGLVMGQVLDRGVKFGYALKNPCDPVKLPAPNKPEVRFLMTDESSHLLECVASAERDALGGSNDLLSLGRLQAVRLGLATGGRLAELLAVEWRDIDFTRRRVTLRGTKTASSWRTIPIDPSTLDLLRGWQSYQKQRFEQYGMTHESSTPVCCNAVGKAINKSNFEHWFRKFADACGYEWLTPHCLRHTVATQWIMNGVDIKTVSYRLGHKDIATTYNIYAHVIEEKHFDHSEKMAAIIGLNNTKTSVFANYLPISRQETPVITQARQAKYAV